MDHGIVHEIIGEEAATYASNILLVFTCHVIVFSGTLFYFDWPNFLNSRPTYENNKEDLIYFVVIIRDLVVASGIVLEYLKYSRMVKYVCFSDLC
jgi:uncharacterized membrane protein YwzB